MTPRKFRPASRAASQSSRQLEKGSAMKRSEINRCIAEAEAFFARNGFLLPRFAEWSPED
ncbi:hypothetical protein SBA5_1100006 [Candidatus Sulfotelmatomonas gaucii]|uniref:D-lyxose ketol-isomerase n=1 Tax=Candidatus Sulfuritelmatomonas gaucii TaxID=2043161 RepID=A0A2N9L3C4_9BACT|nr:hypothetical protein SBA5_1100006 [Candidatus Sulfotelmatomonas gaucii]